MNDRVGRQIGNYRLTRLLGQGGFAQVYLGEHLYLKTQAALKVLSGTLTSENVEAFQQEAQRIAALKHPHILRVLDFGIEASIPFLVLEYAAHGAVRDRYPRGSRLPWPLVVSYCTQLAEALHWAHTTARLIHRDIKPENMLLDEQDTLLLSDFGIATIAHSSATMKTVESIGTPAYMSPEQFAGRPVTASDQYSLAVVVYEWLCGQRPYTADSFIALGMQHASAPLPSLLQHDPTLSPEVEQVVHTALAKDPAERFVSIRAFARALERALQPGSPASLPPTEQAGGEKGGHPSLDPLPTSTLAFPAGFFSLQASTIDVTSSSLVRGGAAKINGVKEAVRPEEGGKKESAVWESLKINCNKPPISTYCAYSNGATAISLSPDGHDFASVGSDNQICIWDVVSGRCRRTHKDNKLAGARQVIWSSKGTYIATALRGKDIVVWHAFTGKEIFSYQLDGTPIDLAFSPDDKWIAVHVDPEKWRSSRNEKPEKTMMVVLDASTGSCVIAYQKSFLNLSPSSVKSDSRTLRWSPNGSWLAMVADRMQIHIWEAQTGKHYYTYKQDYSDIKAFTWSRDGSAIFFATNQYLYRWKVPATSSLLSSWQKKLPFKSEQEEPDTLFGAGSQSDLISWSADGRYAVCLGKENIIEIWEVQERKRLSSYRLASPHSYEKSSVLWSPDETWIIVASRSVIQRLSITSQKVLTTYEGGHLADIRELCWSPDGRYLAGFFARWSNVTYIWEVRTNTGEVPLFSSYRLHGIPMFHSSGASFSPDGQYIVLESHTYYRSFKVAVYDIRRENRIYECDLGESTVCCWSPNSQFLALAGGKEPIKVIEIPSGKDIALYKEHTDHIYVMAWSPDGQSIAWGGEGRTVQVLNMRTGKGSVSYPISSTCRSIAWSPDGTALAFCSESGPFFIVDASTHDLLFSSSESDFGSQYDHELSLFWSPEGNYVACQYDSKKSLSLWMLPQEKCFATHKVPYASVLKWTSQGLFIALARKNEFKYEVKVWLAGGQDTHALHDQAGSANQIAAPGQHKERGRQDSSRGWEEGDQNGQGESEQQQTHIGQAEHFLQQGQKRAAGAIAGVLLEASLKHLCDSHSVSTPPKVGLQFLIQHARKAGLLTSEEASKLTHLAAIRNKCAHASPVSEEEVRLLVEEVKKFVEWVTRES
jgi:serine/threonine protein kinase/Tol biopolymer transport system component